MSLRALRDALSAARVLETPPDNLPMEDIGFSGPGGPVAVRRYMPPRTSGAAVLFLHGGGFAVGSLRSHDRFCALLSLAAGAQVFAVDYRLAPEHPFPAAWDDANAALDWLIAKASIYNISPAFIGVAGDSAGANLCARLAQTRARHIAHQNLFYPFLDLTRDKEDFDAGGMSALTPTTQTVAWIRKAYLRDVDPASPAASPLFESKIGHVPPAFILTAALDPIKTDGVRYAEALAAAGASVKHHQEPHMTHGFLSFSRLFPPAERCLQMAGAHFRETIGV